MKSILAVIVTVVAAMIFLHTDISPWRIVSQTDLDDLNKQIAGLKQQQEQQQQQIVTSFQAPTPHPGAWMWDPNYRTALEKTTVVGAPEIAKSREHGH